MDANGRFRFSIPSMWVGFHRFSGHISNVFDSMIWVTSCSPLCLIFVGHPEVWFEFLFGSLLSGRHQEDVAPSCGFLVISIGVSIAWYQDIPRHCWLDVLYGDSQTPGFGPSGLAYCESFLEGTGLTGRGSLWRRSRGSKARDSVSLHEIGMRILNLEARGSSWNLIWTTPVLWSSDGGGIWMLQDLLDLGTSLKYEV